MVEDDRLSVRVAGAAADGRLIHVAGEIDFGSAPELRARLHQVITGGTSRLVLDVSGVTFCDSSGLGVLVDARSLLLARGGTLIVTGAGGQVARLLRITGLERLFTPGSAAATPTAVDSRAARVG